MDVFGFSVDSLLYLDIHHSDVLGAAQVHLMTSPFLKLADSLSAVALTGIVEADQTETRESFIGEPRIPHCGNAHKKEPKWITVLVAGDCSHGKDDLVLDRFTLHNVEVLPDIAAYIVRCIDGYLTF